jgi:hypothetical protein
MKRPKASLALLALSIMGITIAAEASLPLPGGDSLVTGIAASSNGGFWMQFDHTGQPDGYRRGTYPLLGAPVFESVGAEGSIGAIPGGNGYFVITPWGSIYSRGEASQNCGDQLSGCTGFPESPQYNQRIVGVASAPNGKGFWALGRNGKVYNVGETYWYGDSSKDPQVSTGIVATPTGRGYYIVQEDGGVFAFGDAVFYGSTGGKRPGGDHLTGIALHRNGNNQVDGYWLLGADGGIYTFGRAPFLGNGGIDPLKRRATSLVSFPSAGPTQGYAWVLEDGTVSFVTKP